MSERVTRRAMLLSMVRYGGLAAVASFAVPSFSTLDAAAATVRPVFPSTPVATPQSSVVTEAHLPPTPRIRELGLGPAADDVSKVMADAPAPDWAQAAGDPQRTAFKASESLGTSWSVAWRYQFQVQNREKLFPQAQAIVSAGHVLAPTLMGKLRSFSAGQSGPTVEWTADVGAPIMGSVAADGARAYVADIYGRLSAFSLSTGQLSWGPIQVTNGLPIQSSPLLADGKLMIGGADGTFYARDPASGAAIWSRSVGSPILQTAAWSDTTGTGTVVFGAMDMRVYGINSANGALIWQTNPLYGGAFKDYWPVISGTRVVVRPWSKLPDPGGTGLTTPRRGIEVANYLDDAAQTAALAAYDANPSGFAKTLFVLDLATGAELPPPIHWLFQVTMNGANPPPCVDKDGFLVIPARRPSSLSNNWKSGWARIDLVARKVVDGLLEGTTERGFGNQDENMCVSACSNGVLAFHVQEVNAQFTGFYRQTDKVWYSANGGAATSRLFVNTQGGGANPAAIAGGFAYHLAHPHTLMCFRTA